MALLTIAEVLALTGKTLDQSVVDAAVDGVKKYTGRNFTRATRAAWVHARGPVFLVPDHPVRAIYMVNRGASAVARVSYSGAGSTPSVGVADFAATLSSFTATTGLSVTRVELSNTKTVAQVLVELAAVDGWTVTTTDANLATLPAMMLTPGKVQGLPGAHFFMDLTVPADPLDARVAVEATRVIEVGASLAGGPVFVLYNAGWDDAEVPAAWKSMTAAIAVDLAQAMATGGVLTGETIGDYQWSAGALNSSMKSVLERHATQLALWTNHEF